MPNPSGVNRRKRARQEPPRFLRKPFAGYGRGASSKILRILGWTLAIWFVSAILLGDSGLFSIFRMRSMKSDLVEENEALEAERDVTAEYRDDLENDPATIERVAREDYGMIREGETVYRLPSEETETEEE
jgi:cell division protein FtsB